MTLLSPWFLLCGLAPLALAAAYVVAQRRRGTYVARFTSVDLLASVAPRFPGWRRHVSALFVLLAAGALVVGLARPAVTERVPRDRGTVLLAIDTSGSMEATDVTPSRLAATQTAARRFVEQLPRGIRVGVLAFDSTARLLAPPAADRTPALDAIAGLEVGGGTATSEAIDRSLAALAAAAPKATAASVEGPPGVIVLMSDGAPTIGNGIDTPEQSLTAAVAEARAARVPINTIAFGTAAGTVVREGETIPVPVDPATMQRIARDSGGRSFSAESGDELDAVYEQIRRSVGYETVTRDITRWWLAGGLLLLLLAGAAGVRWMQRIP